MNLTKPERFVLNWNSRFPIDLWWRRKYNIPFGSSLHREMSHWDMFLEFTEIKLAIEWQKSLESKELNDDLVSLGFGKLDTKKVVKIDPHELDSEFDALDINQFNEKTDKGKEEKDILP